MDVMTAILTRRSQQVLDGPSPCDEEFTYLVQGASTAPDHGRLRPWRWVLLRDDDRDVLGSALAEDVEDEQTARQVAAKLHRAPLTAALVFSPHAGHRVPEWEQLAAASCMAHSLMLLLHSRGYGSIWRTGRLARSASACAVLGLDEGEQLLGSLDIGTPDPASAKARRPLEDVSARVTRFRDVTPRETAKVPVGSHAA
ncbi:MULTISPECIES: nitroreductase [unclassified Streptomyces]|uniref:nitroreductase family protein n=1 Tax=unclassified Streptomyces TaxID=2593676 RepID=UPI003811BE22